MCEARKRLATGLLETIINSHRCENVWAAGSMTMWSADDRSCSKDIVASETPLLLVLQHAAEEEDSLRQIYAILGMI